MVNMYIVSTDKFDSDVNKVKDKRTKDRLKKQIKKLMNNPRIGKPLKYSFKRERTIYVRPFRLIYTLDKNKIILLRFEHRKSVYK